MIDSQKKEFREMLTKLFIFLKNKLKLKSTPKLTLSEDKENSSKLLGKTGYYNPETKGIVLFITDRHPKDILRSFAHEVIHAWQDENGQLNGENSDDPQYAQNDSQLRKMEKQAYLLGNMMFRDWEDGLKNSNQI